jgi:hypothetical protein
MRTGGVCAERLMLFSIIRILKIVKIEYLDVASPLGTVKGRSLQ